MSALRVLTVDDETLALRRLKIMLQAIPNVEHVGEASSCAEALASIAALAPDAVLLDIKMRDGDGFDVVEMLAERPNPPAIIFVTAFDHYAVRAFEDAVVDYLLKPVERERLARALRRAREQLRALDTEQRLSEMQEVVRNLRSLAGGRNGTPPFESEFWLRGAAGLVRVPLDSIDCVSSEDDYVAIHTSSGSHLMRGSIRQFEARVEPGYFVRVHRRWLVRRSVITELRTRFGNSEVLLRTGRRLPVGRVYLKQLKQTVKVSRPAARNSLPS